MYPRLSGRKLNGRNVARPRKIADNASIPKRNARNDTCVDDDELVLEVVTAILKAQQFRVLSAHSAAAALKLAEASTETIDLLLSDVDMPEMSGPDLGEAMKKSRPAMHVMLMSGGSNGNLLVLNYGWAYIQKPLLAVKLVQMVNDVLHSQNRRNSADRSLMPGGTLPIRNISTDKIADVEAISSRRFLRCPSIPLGRAGLLPAAGRKIVRPSLDLSELYIGLFR
jgi:CheY-like chemotaxis protein